MIPLVLMWLDRVTSASRVPGRTWRDVLSARPCSSRTSTDCSSRPARRPRWFTAFDALHRPGRGNSMYFNSSGSHTMQAATLTSGTLAMSAFAFAHAALLVFALAFAGFVVFRLVRRSQVVGTRRIAARRSLGRAWPSSREARRPASGCSVPGCRLLRRRGVRPRGGFSARVLGRGRDQPAAGHASPGPAPGDLGCRVLPGGRPAPWASSRSPSTTARPRSPRNARHAQEEEGQGDDLPAGRPRGRLPRLVRRIHDEGHVIGNHSWSHRPFIALSDADALSEITRTNEAIRRSPESPPNSSATPRVSRATRATGPSARSGCGAGSCGTGRPTQATTPAPAPTGAALSQRNATDQALLLLHDGNEVEGCSQNQPKYLPRAIDSLRARGFEFGVVASAGGPSWVNQYSWVRVVHPDSTTPIRR